MNWREYQRMQKVATVGDRFVSYVDEGSGEPVVLLHGIPTWGYLWHGLVPALARTHRILVPDLPGFGFSDRSDRFDRGIARQAEMLDGWMAALGIEGAAIVAHDIGGGVALRLATLFPRRVGRLCVMNGVCYDSWPVEAMLQLGHPSVRRMTSADKVVAGLRRAVAAGCAGDPGDEMVDGLLAPYATETGKLSLVRNAASLNTNHTTEITSLLPGVAVPALVLWGEQDPWQLVEYGERLAGDLPRARFVRLADARHFVMLDRPDAVLAELEVFLRAT